MPRIDRISFWIGFAVGLLFAWLFSSLRKGWPHLVAFVKAQIQAARESMTAGTEARLRNDMLRLAQHQHLAAPFAALDEILVTPELMTPPGSMDPDNMSIVDESSQQAIPYLPDWPELAATFFTPTLSLVDVLRGKSNLVLMGQPGSGKTVALAYLTTLFARKDPLVAEFGNLVPVFLHAGDIDLYTAEKDPLTPFVDALATRVSSLTLPRLPNLLHNVFDSGRVILIIDGVDEFGPDAAKQVIDLVKGILARYPTIRIIIATTPIYYDGLTAAGFLPVAMAAWNENKKAQFITNWRELWSHLLISDTQQPGLVDPMILSGWLSNRETPPNPLEYTLKVWAAFAGDALGGETSHAIEAYIRRMTVNIRNARPALEKLAGQMLLGMQPYPSQRDAETWLAEFEPIGPTTGDPSKPEQPSGSGKKKSSARPSANVIPTLVSNGVLVNRRGAYIGFIHPVLLGYLCGNTLAKTGEAWNLQNQPDWIGKTITLQYLAHFGNVSNLVESLLAQWDDALKRGVLTTGRWLHTAPKNVPWRGAVMRSLATTVQKEQTTLGISARAVAALALTGDPSLTTYFRQLFKSSEPNLRLLGILGCGMAHDTKIIADLSEMAEDPVPNVGRAACMALMAIGNKSALESIATILVRGSDASRRAAAEVLAENPEEGYPTLQEGANVDDLLVRHAIVFGLAKVNEPWAVELLEKLAIEDGQWVVRNAAAQALEDTKRLNPHIPVALPPLHEIPWLIKYAAKSGSGVSPGKQAVEVLTKALKDGDEYERMAALDYVRLNGNEDHIVQIYHILYGSQGELRETAFNTLWHLAATGITLPSPTQFGLG
jgi:HEAT repeat protein